MPASREQIAQATAKRLASAASSLATIKAFIGLDGFVDEIIAVVDKRQSFQSYDPVKTIAHLGQKILNAAGQSSNYELIVKQMKLGGNGPIMANALASFGLAVTYVGSLGYPALHPVFQEMAGRAKVISIADAGHTDALEFEDGKLMLGKITSMNEVTWANLVERAGGTAELRRMVDESALFGFVNWTMLPHMSDIWDRLRTEIMPSVSKKPRKFFVDLCDPEKRTHADIERAMRILTQLQESVDVILGLNLKEALAILDVLGLAAPTDPEATIEETAKAIRQLMKIYCCVVHPRSGAAAATSSASAKFAGPFVQQPRISTGAGDHFNAGFALGQVLGLELDQSLCCGVGTSGYYVRTGISPTAKQLAEFVETLPAPQS
ncbi:MAG TPA: PfkB family carbohydrate kinase [Tepidisphaeraceae bacterium]|nr:PfkB family carbohydrate kinase [Tepidisphaeraceae bacterium]